MPAAAHLKGSHLVSSDCRRTGGITARFATVCDLRITVCGNSKRRLQRNQGVSPTAFTRLQHPGKRLTPEQRPPIAVMATASGSTLDLEHALSVARTAADAAGHMISEAFSKPKSVEHKGKVDLVTETDKACEKLIFGKLREAFPDHAFIGEEGSAEQGFTSELTDTPTWLVDPVDGTTNFVHRQPYVCVSIALAVNSQVVVGVVHNPILGETFTAVRGGGALLNGQPVRASSESDLASALVATEVGVTRDAATVDAIFDRITRVAVASRSLRCLGSCALNLCSVAMGRLDAFYEIGFGGPWDVAAAALVLEEAGGEVVDPAGGTFNLQSRRVLGANSQLIEPLARIIAGAKCSATEPQPI